MKKGCMFNKKNKVSETMICRYIYHPHLDSRIERYCFSLPFVIPLPMGADIRSIIYQYLYKQNATKMHHSDNHTTIVSGGVLYGYSRKFVFQSKCLVIIFFIFFFDSEYVG